ncbi:hypothetical protein GRJ2_003399400 [Grus japonensis]|uniref:Uncharacterized protein n=1 Tax=Grus japonensis TaxID=30415 RepID=A0ABC9YKM2_GRUJA
MVKQAVPLQQPMEDGGEQRFHLQPVEDPTPEQVEAPEGGCDPVGSPRWSKLLAGPVDPWREEPMPEQDPELYHLMVTAAKAAFDLHIYNELFLVCEYEVQQSTSPW